MPHVMIVILFGDKIVWAYFFSIVFTPLFLIAIPLDPVVGLLPVLVVHDNVEPSKGAFSVGTSMAATGLSTGIYYFDPASSGLVNRDFKDVGASGEIHCYETRERFGDSVPLIIILQLTSPTTLRMEGQDFSSCGDGPWLFSSAYTDYER